jgi:hypothetical protein
MIATAKPWTAKPGCPGTITRNYFEGGRYAVDAEVTRDPAEGRVWFKAWRTTGTDRFGRPTRELIAHGSLAATPHAAAVAKARASRAASRAARADATAYYKAKMARAIERMEAARALLDATDMSDYRTLAHRQDELQQLIAELDHVGRMLALAA